MSFSCANCSKVYKRISAYQKHYSLCRIIRRRDDDGDNDDDQQLNKLSSLSKEEMGCILKDILVKYQLMEKKVNELSACISIKKKKVNVIEWLNTNKKNTTVDFDTWVSNLKINKSHLEYVFEHSIVKLFSYIILQLTELTDGDYNVSVVPISAFTHKDGSLYVYNTPSCWGYMSDDQLRRLISVIRLQINTEFKSWQDENKDAILKDETYRDLYLNNINKVMYTNYKNDEDLSLKVQREIYGVLKTSITI